MEQHKFGPRERREIQEATAFMLLWKVALFSLVAVLEVSILSNMPADTTPAVKGVTYCTLIFTALSLLLALLVESDKIFRRSFGLFALGLVGIAVGLWSGWFVFG